MQFLFGGYSLGQPGLVIDPFSLVMKPPHAAARKKRGQNSELETDADVQTKE